MYSGLRLRVLTDKTEAGLPDGGPASAIRAYKVLAKHSLLWLSFSIMGYNSSIETGRLLLRIPIQAANARTEAGTQS